MITFTFNMSELGKADQYSSETYAVEIYGIRYEEKELKIFSSNVEIVEHTKKVSTP